MSWSESPGNVSALLKQSGWIRKHQTCIVKWSNNLIYEDGIGLIFINFIISSNNIEITDQKGLGESKTSIVMVYLNELLSCFQPVPEGKDTC
jgi:hypothetical protein